MAARGGGRGRGGGFDRGGRGGRGGGFDRGGRGGHGGAPSGAVLYNPGEALQQPSPQVQKRENDVIAAKKGLSMKSLSISGSNLPERPGYGTLGRQIVLRTNYFHLLPRADKKIFKYSVEILPEVKAARQKRRIFELLLQNSPLIAAIGPGVATDYSSTMLASKELDLGADGRREVPLSYYEKEDVLPGQVFKPDQRTKQYKITIQNTGYVAIPELLEYLDSNPAELSPNSDAKLETIQALNIIMARTPNTTDNVVTSSGNKFFPYPSSFPERRDRDGRMQLENSLGSGLVALKGYYSSVRTSTLRVLLNVNVCTSAFYPAINLWDLFRLRMSSPDYGKLEPFIKKLRVSTNHIKRNGASVTHVKTIRGFSRPPRARGLYATAQQITFRCEDLPGVNPDQDITVEQYYLKKYNIKLQQPGVALIDVGTAEKATYLPVELCRVLPRQMYRRKLTDDETAEMIKYAARPPQENAVSIVNRGLGVVGIFGNKNNLVHDAFGLKVEPRMITVNARILASPKILYKPGQDATPRDGSWNMIRIQFTAPVAIKDWSYIKFSLGSRRPDNQFKSDLEVFQKTLKDCGLGNEPHRRLPRHEADLTLDEKRNDEIIKGLLKEVADKTPTKILLIILPNTNAITYARVKYWADVVFGIHTVCVVGNDRKFYNNQGTKQIQYCTNVALKFNLKRGGVNQSLPNDKMGMLQDGKTMVVGIDVTHPSPGSIDEAPSIAGVVASIDKRYAQWPASIRPQKSRQEMVDGLDQMIIERLQLWRKHNGGKLPEKILVYRDGVSEGQYETVLRDELPGFQKACEKLYGKMPQPKISMIIVGKRHHTRFYATSTEDCDSKGNTKNGTVVDRGVTMERGWDFFLQAHTCIQGTARPAHYVVIRDEIGLGADGLEQMTHNLCYLFGRATKAVSICPPAYYADLLCERGRCYLQKDLAADTGSINSGRKFNWATSDWSIQGGVHPRLQDTMFYI